MLATSYNMPQIVEGVLWILIVAAGAALGAAIGIFRGHRTFAPWVVTGAIVWPFLTFATLATLGPIIYALLISD